MRLCLHRLPAAVWGVVGGGPASSYRDPQYSQLQVLFPAKYLSHLSPLDSLIHKSVCNVTWTLLGHSTSAQPLAVGSEIGFCF